MIKNTTEEAKMQETIYVIQWTEEHGEPTGIGVEIEHVHEVVARDTDWMLVSSHDLGTLERIVEKYPGWSMSGEPASGEFVDIGGDEFLVEGGALIEKVRLSLDVDGNSYGADEEFSPEEVNRAGGLDQLIDDYIARNQERIIDIHNLPEGEEIQDPRQYVDVTTWYTG